MSNVTSKILSEKDGMQVLRGAFNDVDSTIAVSGFLDSKVGHRIQNDTISATIDDTRFLDEVTIETCTLNSTTTITVPNTINFKVGQYVLLDVGTAGIPAGTKIASIDSSTQITLTQAATVSGSFTVHFANLLKRLRLFYNNAGHDILLDAARIE